MLYDETLISSVVDVVVEKSKKRENFQINRKKNSIEREKLSSVLIPSSNAE